MAAFRDKQATENSVLPLKSAILHGGLFGCNARQSIRLVRFRLIGNRAMPQALEIFNVFVSRGAFQKVLSRLADKAGSPISRW
jgi:hypothetical protein